MFSKKVDKWRMNKSDQDKTDVDGQSKRYRAAIDKNTSVEVIKDKEIIYWVIKKDLGDYDVSINASEAPIANLYSKEPEPFESCIADKAILDKELFPVASAMKNVFDVTAVELDKIALIIGSGESDYVTVDETDLKNMRVEPTLFGLEDFVEKNKDGILGLGIREFEPERGNLTFFKAKLMRPNKNIIFIEVVVSSSLQQRGFFIQKEHSWLGLQKYIVIKTTQIDDEKVLAFLQEIDINWELIFLRRSLAINDWIEIECERNAGALKQYLRFNYPILGYMDVQNIVKVVEANHLNFKVASRMAEVLNKQKKETLQDNSIDVSYQPLAMAEIVAAARLAAAYHGERKNIKHDPDVRVEDVIRYEKILASL
nr:hypothetical protein [Candidatus Sigynarchaeota archaeon]